jgi:hypothetical protein
MVVGSEQERLVSERPTGITVLAILAWLAGLANVVGALQDFGYLPTVGGTGAGFFVSDPIDGLLQIGAAIVSLFLAGGLWGIHDWARKTIVIIAAVNIVIVFFSKFEGSESWLNALPGLIVNAAILLYARSAEVRQALVR